MPGMIWWTLKQSGSCLKFYTKCTTTQLVFKVFPYFQLFRNIWSALIIMRANYFPLFTIFSSLSTVRTVDELLQLTDQHQSSVQKFLRCVKALLKVACWSLSGCLQSMDWTSDWTGELTHLYAF